MPGRTGHSEAPEVSAPLTKLDSASGQYRLLPPVLAKAKLLCKEKPHFCLFKINS